MTQKGLIISGILFGVTVIAVAAVLLRYKVTENPDTPENLIGEEKLITKRYDKSGQKSYGTAKPGIYQQDPRQDGKDIWTSWEELEAQGLIRIKDGVLSTALTDDKNNDMIKGKISGVMVVPDYITAIEKNTFAYCPIDELIIPEGVERIGKDAFADCSWLVRISLPKSLKSIGHGAFSNCGIDHLTVPKEVKKIGAYAFFDIPHIEYKGTATYKKNNKYWGAKSMN